MNWRRGLFRVWVLAAVLWFAFVAYDVLVDPAEPLVGEPLLASLYTIGIMGVLPPLALLLVGWLALVVAGWIRRGFRG